MIDLLNELWALRDNEGVEIVPGQPIKGRWIAVQLVPCELPPGPQKGYRDTDKPPAPLLVIAADCDNEGLWKWLHLSSATKEAIGDLLLDETLAKPGQWYYAIITDQRPLTD